MKKNNIIYIILSISLLFIASISLLALQDNDIKVPQQEVTIKLDLSHKFNVNVAKKEEKDSLLSSN